MNHDQFLENLERRGRTAFTVLGQYAGSANRIEVQCKTCGNVWKPRAKELVRGSGCNHCYQTARVERTANAVTKRRAYLDGLPTRDCVNCTYYLDCSQDKGGGCPLYKPNNREEASCHDS